MSNVTIHDLINTNSVECRVYQMMETSLIVSEVFCSMLITGKINGDYVFGEGEGDTYDTLIGITLEIENKNAVGDMPYPDIREMAEELILKAYSPLKKYSVQREYFKEVVVEAKSMEEAEKIANEQHLFDTVTLEPGDTDVTEIG